MAKNKEECLQMVAGEVKRVRESYQPEMTQTKLAKKIGKTNQCISNIENARGLPEIETLVEIAGGTGTNLIIEFKSDEQLKADEELKKLISRSNGK